MNENVCIKDLGDRTSFDSCEQNSYPSNEFAPSFLFLLSFIKRKNYKIAKKNYYLSFLILLFFF